MAQGLKQSGDQVWSVDGYDTHARFVSTLGAGIKDWLAVEPGEHVLDLGCGDGALTVELVADGAHVVGVDSSAEFVAKARQRGLTVHLMDGHDLPFKQEFDAVFSNAALHWMTGAKQVVTNVARALKPNGRFVAEFGGHGNVAAIVTAVRAVVAARGGNADLAFPWFFPTTDEYAALLEEAGFSVRRIALIPRPTPLPTDMAGWLRTFCEPFFAQFGDESDMALQDVVNLLKPSLCDVKGNWTADYVRLRVDAVSGATDV